MCCTAEKVPEVRRLFEETSMPALDQDEDRFQINVWDLIRPLEERRRTGQQSPVSPQLVELKTYLPPQSPCQPGPDRQLLGAKQFHTFMETGDPKQALRTTPTSTPSTRKPSVRRPHTACRKQ